MTGLLHEKEFSRKSFVKGSGALIVGFSLAGSALAGKASAAPSPAGYLPSTAAVDSWLSVNADNTVTLKTSQIEVGNGLPTGFLMVAAEELNMDMSQMQYAREDTWVIASTGGEGGSNAISGSSPKVRAAAVAAYQALLGMASKSLGVPASSLTAASGTFTGGGKSVSYGTLIGGKLFNATINPTTLAPGQSPAKALASMTLVGTSPQRIDIPAKVNGSYTYVQNIRVPGMLHGRVVRPRGQGAVTAQDYIPLSVDQSSIAQIPNAKVWQLGNFLGVTAPKEYDAIQAAAQLKVTWKSDPLFAGSGNFWKVGREQADAAPAKYTTNTGNVAGALASSAHVISATYQYAYNGHMSIGPTCAVAVVTPTQATIFCNAQSIEGVPTTLASLSIGGKSVLGLTAQNIRAIFYEGSGSYGSNPTTDVYEAAAVMSKLANAPVRLQFMRWDENGWDNYGPATMYDVRAGADTAGNITALDWTSYTQGGASVTPTAESTGASAYASTPAVGAASTSDTIYNKTVTGPNGNKRILAKSFPLYNGYLRSSSLRAPGAPQSHFAGEQIVDELAYAAGMDPVAFRRQNIDGTTTIGARWLAVMDAATIAAGWQPKVANSVKQTGNIRTGRGFAFGTFANTQVAMVADVSVNMKTGKLVASHLYIAQNTGFTVSPGLVANQISGAAIMGLSRAMWEEVTMSKERVTSLDWVSYPILRFADSPTVTTVVVSPGKYTTVLPGGVDNIVTGNAAAIAEGWTSTGSGEPSTVPPGAAMANAFFDATGVRLRESPMTPARTRATLRAAGVT